MNLMICMNGEPDQLPFLPEIASLGAGIELGSYGLVGVQSVQAWETRVAKHMAIRAEFPGMIAIHGPFIGMEYDCIDHMLLDAVKRRLDMTFDAAVKLEVDRVILHSGYKLENDVFKLQDSWLRRSAEFWRQEIGRWAEA